MKKIDESALSEYFEFQRFLGRKFDSKTTPQNCGEILTIDDLDHIVAAGDTNFLTFLKIKSLF